MLSLYCCLGFSLVAMCRLLLSVASLAAELGLLGTGTSVGATSGLGSGRAQA